MPDATVTYSIALSPSAIHCLQGRLVGDHVPPQLSVMYCDYKFNLYSFAESLSQPIQHCVHHVCLPLSLAPIVFHILIVIFITRISKHDHYKDIVIMLFTLQCFVKPV